MHFQICKLKDNAVLKRSKSNKVGKGNASDIFQCTIEWDFAKMVQPKISGETII